MGGWAKPLPVVKAKKGADDDEKRKARVATIKGASSEAPPKQRMGWHAILPLVAGLLWAGYQEQQNPTMGLADGNFGVLAVITALSYVYCDFWLWTLHCFLDRVENLESKFMIIKVSAFDFQEHHDLPVQILNENHLGTIDEVIAGTMAVALLLGAWTGPEAKLFAVGVCLWGAVGCLNHYFCHVRTHNRPIPALYRLGQDWGMLPSSKHHKTHHTSPFEENWNFLVGAHILYEWVYAATGTRFWGVGALFYTCNPVALQLWAFALLSTCCGGGGGVSSGIAAVFGPTPLSAFC